MASKGNLPAEVVGFVGRHGELRESRRLLEASRLLTLVGVGGVGKTRLALRMANEASHLFADGVWFADLTDVPQTADQLLVEQAVAAAFNLRDFSRRRPSDALLEHLSGWNCLLVLDNCEHVVEEATALLTRLLSNLDGLCVIATSREILRSDGEYVLQVRPLSVSGPSGAPSGRATSGGEALELLRQRAAAVGAAIQEADLPHAVELCQRLDGIPLAIELAAGRLMTLSVAEVLERLDDRFRLLTGGARHGPVAHQTVRQVMDWSYQLCTAHGKLLWQRVSVFSGGFDLTAAEQVCGGDNIPVEDVLDVLAGLVRQSVLVVERDGSTIRYRLLETLRQYGSQMLAQANQEQSYRARHRDYYQHMAAHAAQDWFSEREPRWIRRVRGEMANFRAAIMYSSTEDAVGTAGLETAVNIARLPIWLFDGWPAEGRGWLERTLDSAPGCGDSLRVTALAFIGWFAVLQGDIASAGKLLVDCRQATAGGQAIVPTAAFFEGVYAFLVDGNPNSVALLAQAHRVSAEAGEPKATVAQAEMMWSLAASFLCDPETGRAAAEQHLENATHHGGPIWAATAKFAVAVPLTRQGNPRRAVNLLREALRVQREMDDRWGIMWSTDALVWALAALVRSSPATDGRYDADSARTVARLLGGARQMRKWLGLSGAGVFESEHAVAEHVVRDILGESTYLAELRNGSFPEERENDGMRRIISLAMGERMPSEPSEPHILTKNSDLPKLTNREMEITALIAKGLSNPEIARKLVISDRTVQTHVTNILNKRGLRNRHQLAVWYAGDNQN